jgi:sensor histidine kinase YesM
VLFKLDIADQRLNCTIQNSKHANKELSDSRYSGIGLTNVKKSLELLFGKDYTLDILDNENEFTVNLSVPYHEN